MMKLSDFFQLKAEKTIFTMLFFNAIIANVFGNIPFLLSFLLFMMGLYEIAECINIESLYNHGE